MCKELDYAEQLDSNLTVLSKDKWIKAHIDEEYNQEETEGKNKKQKEYDVTVYINTYIFKINKILLFLLTSFPNALKIIIQNLRQIYFYTDLKSLKMILE